MANKDQKSGDARPPAKAKPGKEKTEPTPGWEKVVFAPDRVDKFVKGEITLQELNAISGPEMLELAVIGYSLYEQGKFDDARVVFQGLATFDPKESYYRTALGAVYLAQEDLKNAEGCFNDALRLNPKDLASYVNRGEVFLRRGRILDAAQDFSKVAELDPENKDPLSQRARILAAAALEQLKNSTSPGPSSGATNRSASADNAPKGAAAAKPNPAAAKKK